MEFRKNIKRIIIPILLLIFMTGAIIGVLNYQESRREPNIELFEPKEGMETESNEVTVKGKIDDINDEVFVKGQRTEVLNDGSFQAKVALDEGDNPILVEAVTKGGKRTARNVSIKRIARIQGDKKKTEDEGAFRDKENTEKTPKSEAQQPLTQAGSENMTPVFIGLLTVVYLYYKSKKIFLDSFRGFRRDNL